MQLAEVCPAGFECDMDMPTSVNTAWLPARPRAGFEATEAAGEEAAGEQPLAPFPPRPEPPKVAPVKGGDIEAGEVGMEETLTVEDEYGHGDSAAALLFEDDVWRDDYVGMDTDPRTRRCCPCPLRWYRLFSEVVSSGTAGIMRPKVSMSITPWTPGSERRRIWQVRWSGLSSSRRRVSPGRRPLMHSC